MAQHKPTVALITRPRPLATSTIDEAISVFVDAGLDELAADEFER
jgi:hypothetical protein